MNKKICNLEINYIKEGKGENVLILHGWGANIESVRCIFDFLKTNYSVTAVDLPGFGKSQSPKKIWGTYDYYKFVLEFINELDIKEVNIIGHSFGGKISTILSSENPEIVNKLILVDSSGIKPKRTIKYYFKVYSFKIVKTFLKLLKMKKTIEKMRNKFGSKDYQKAGHMRESLVKIVNEDIRDYLPKIESPTLLIWGENDTDTPLYMAETMNKLIRNSGVAIIKGGGHYSYLDNFREFSIIIDYFLKH